MSENDTRSLNVVIGGINIPVRLQKSEKEYIEETAAEINTRLKDIQLRYPDRKTEEALAMTMLSLMMEKGKEKKLLSDRNEILQELDQVESILDKLLQ